MEWVACPSSQQNCRWVAWSWVPSQSRSRQSIAHHVRILITLAVASKVSDNIKAGKPLQELKLQRADKFGTRSIWMAQQVYSAIHTFEWLPHDSLTNNGLGKSTPVLEKLLESGMQEGVVEEEHDKTSLHIYGRCSNCGVNYTPCFELRPQLSEFPWHHCEVLLHVLDGHKGW